MSNAKPTIDDMISSVCDDTVRADVIKKKIAEEELTKRERAPYQTGMVAIVSAALFLTCMVTKFAVENVVELRAKEAVDMAQAQRPVPAAPSAFPAYRCTLEPVPPTNPDPSRRAP